MQSLLSLVPALLLSMLAPIFLLSSSVSLSYFILAVTMRECFGNHSFISSPFPISILNETFFSLSLVQEKLKLRTGQYYLPMYLTRPLNHSFNSKILFHWQGFICREHWEYETSISRLCTSVGSASLRNS